jgi:hypothetical protein
MTVGDTLYCSESGCSQCPVCRGLVSLSCAFPYLQKNYEDVIIPSSTKQ